MAKRTAKSKKTQKKTLKHHALHVYHVTPKFIHGMVAGAFVGIILVISLGIVKPTSALTLDSFRDCDDWAVIKCGSISTGELQKDYKADSSVGVIFKHFNISASDIDTIDTKAVAGYVYDDGKVTVNGKTVATDAITAARKNVTGSAKVTTSGVEFYVRHVKVSFAHKKVPAFVVYKDGKFDYAVLASCGNPIIASPVVTPAKVPTPPPPPPTTPTPTPIPTPTPPPPVVETVSAPEALPNAGPAGLIIIAVLSVIGGYIFHMSHRHVQRKRAASGAHHKHAAHRTHHAHR
jgi:hypothetical protein